MIRGHIIELKPNNVQANHFARACGVARKAYNWALHEWQRQYREDKAYRDACLLAGIEIDSKNLNRPSQAKLRRELNAIKRELFPWMTEVTKCAPQAAIMQLGDAYNNFFKGLAEYPVTRKRGKDDRFSLSNDQFAIKGKSIRIPNLGWVRMKEALRFDGKIMAATISKRGGKWFVSVAVDLDHRVKKIIKTGKSVGIDLGITDLLVLSDGTKIKAPKPLAKYLSKLRTLNKNLSRTKKGSKNREKAKTKLSRLHYKIRGIRQDSLHKITSSLVREFDVIAIESLNVKGMVKNRKLSRAISDLGFFEFKRQLIYKANEQGKVVKSVGRFYPSSKTCSNCNHILGKDELTLKMREWTCPECQSKHDRDLNASINILNNATVILTVA
ncbi:RNA-guided endonuclease InsQ/TnpB family protein [Psychrobacter sp. LV10R520-6]|uniref:RNA-guided endonuclease InsQ/TnpB family protein n=1 Tax=Psychrobacter sp. LV10R520-6 TaxID=1415574 RepID=UPI0024CB5B54|nr:RNA-guided endonuclease TnpB family protein [Psychrobacter sp. LV10R520-6]SNT68995.1 putative transposase [Psychrobacter sp. LV10R520-6]SNT69670.1 putative transposase [Psychrobacter sp. LV10R520-6]SNT70283.1 putative transposase [Psychrobacter sp. LV10R520-6]SNT70345.1 putative transposase [Psychrobacter sp. LV10R520-6]SNT71383.1 putative transposase [Psychrobacter sp. LV10R520-6]